MAIRQLNRVIQHWRPSAAGLALAILIIASSRLVWAADPGNNEPMEVPWSFKPVARPALPSVRDVAWGRGDIDRFILARIEAAGLTPNRDADRQVLIRRAAYDLIGLPPTPAEIATFVADPAPDDVAFARVVDHYLQSPRFGERWGRHWLDVVRYADSVGRSWNAPFLYAWRYRDYVIDAFNKDKPYDRFILEQLAGDLLPARTLEEEREQRIATGFLAIGSVPLQEGSREQFLLDRVDDQIDASTRAFLGLTIACARCHNHKTDPINTRDYYALAGVFYSTRTLSGQGSIAGEENSKDYVNAHLLLRLPRPPGSKPDPEAAASEIHTMSDYMEVARSGKRLGIRYTFDPDRAMGVTEGSMRDCAIRVKGDPRVTKPAPPRGDVHIPGLPDVQKVPADASGRLEVARWIASGDNPLTARVMVNRVWQHLLGHGLVRTPDDFGSTGEEPTHPELLDHLATRFSADDWSVKKLIRSIMLSRTYRLSSSGQKAGREKDPQNDLYYRANLRRLEVEPLRDSLLAAAGRLTDERPTGIPVSGSGGKGTGAAAHSVFPANTPYRTVYLPIFRSLVPELQSTFDFPDPCQVMGQREVTTVAPQALFFMNGEFVTDCARSAAVLLLKEEVPSKNERVQLAYRRILSRAANADEVQDALGLLDSLNQTLELNRWTILNQALMASAEFRYVR